MAGDLISREDALRVFYNKEPLVQGEHDGMGMLAHALWRHIREAVEAIPAVEAEPVVHAHWVPEEGFRDRYVITTIFSCSNCRGRTVVHGVTCRDKRCKHCGAHMDEEVAENG